MNESTMNNNLHFMKQMKTTCRPLFRNKTSNFFNVKKTWTSSENCIQNNTKQNKTESVITNILLIVSAG